MGAHFIARLLLSCQCFYCSEKKCALFIETMGPVALHGAETYGQLKSLFSEKHSARAAGPRRLTRNKTAN